MSKIFNTKIHKLRREKAFKNWDKFSYLKKISSDRLCERLFEINREFEVGLELGSFSGELGFLLKKNKKIRSLFQTDFIFDYCKKSKENNFNSLLIDYEKIPFKECKFDVVLSTFFVHWIEDIPKLLEAIKKTMKNDSLLLINFFGGKTLSDLQKQLINLEIKYLGGSSPRVMPFIDIKNVGRLIQNAGFKMPVIDSEDININHSSLYDLMYDLRGMGQTNSMKSTFKPLNRRVLKILEKKLLIKDKVNSIFELITVTAWK